MNYAGHDPDDDRRTTGQESVDTLPLPADQLDSSRAWGAFAFANNKMDGRPNLRWPAAGFLHVRHGFFDKATALTARSP